MDHEHDCIPPMEHTGSWVLSANAVQSITEALQKMFPAPSRADEAFEELRRLALSPRGYRKAVRWDEKNRRRRLKGLPEKPCPYPVVIRCVIQLPPQGPFYAKVVWSEGGTENDQTRDDEGA